MELAERAIQKVAKDFDLHCDEEFAKTVFKPMRKLIDDLMRGETMKTFVEACNYENGPISIIEFPKMCDTSLVKELAAIEDEYREMVLLVVAMKSHFLDHVEKIQSFMDPRPQRDPGRQPSINRKDLPDTSRPMAPILVSSNPLHHEFLQGILPCELYRLLKELVVLVGEKLVRIYPYMEVHYERGMAALHVTCCRAHSKVLAQHAAFLGHKHFAVELAQKSVELRVVVNKTWKVTPFVEGMTSRGLLRSLREKVESAGNPSRAREDSQHSGKSTLIHSNKSYRCIQEQRWVSLKTQLSGVEEDTFLHSFDKIYSFYGCLISIKL